MSARKDLPNAQPWTILLYGEGASERAFLTHLKHQFVRRESFLSIKVDAGFGGAPARLLRNLADRVGVQRFDRVVLVADMDVRFPPPLHQSLVAGAGFAEIPTADIARWDCMKAGGRACVIGSRPCLEGLLLRVLGESVSETEPSSNLKRRLARRLGLNADRFAFTPANLVTHFGKQLLDSRRGAVPELDRLIDIIETGDWG
jgi:hypothetical protein